MSFEALSCKEGGASVSICTSKALILRILTSHLLRSTIVITLPCILTYCSTRFFLLTDSHIQRTVFATEETTVTQQVSPRLIKCQSRSWSPRVTTVHGSHNGEGPLLKSTGIQFATKSMLGTTNNVEHRKLIGVKIMSLFGYGIQFSLTGVLPVFQNLNTSYREDYRAAQPTKSSRVCIAMHLQQYFGEIKNELFF